MRVLVDVAGQDGTHEVDLTDLAGSTGAGATDERPTYADLLDEVGFSPQEVSVLVEGRPVPEDGAVEAEEVTILRLIAGG